MKNGEHLLPYRDWGLGAEERMGFNRDQGTVGDLRVNRNVKDHEKKKSHLHYCSSAVSTGVSVLEREYKTELTRK